jgi:hypothetical protein
VQELFSESNEVKKGASRRYEIACGTFFSKRYKYVKKYIECQSISAYYSKKKEKVKRG